YLQDQLDIPAAVYHSKLQKHDRVAVHELFMQEAIKAVVATNAFGLGIDKPNIRFVVHYDLPGSIEAYTQEAGRAGRAGKPSKCILVYRMSDTRVQNYFLTGKYPDIEEVQRVFGTLEVFGTQEGGVSLTDPWWLRVEKKKDDAPAAPRRRPIDSHKTSAPTPPPPPPPKKKTTSD